MAMADVTNVLAVGMMTPPKIVRRVTASDNFADIIHAAVPTKFHYQDCCPPWPHRDEEQQQPSHQRRASHRRIQAIDWTDIVASTTQSYPSHDEDSDGADRPNPARKFEQLRTNTLCNQRKSRSSEFSYHAAAVLHTQRYSTASSSSSKELYSHHQCNQDYQDNVTPSSCILPSNISELISNLNAKAKLLSREEDEYDDSSSLEYSSDDSMIEAAIYKSVVPLPPMKQEQQQPTEFGGKPMKVKDLICAVCLDFPDDPQQIATVSGCTHRFCFGCIDKWAARGNHECPLCKSTFHLVTSGERVRWY